MNYGTLTLNELVRFVNANPSVFTRGMETQITSGDFEGNTYHRKFELMEDGNKIHLGFELNEM